MRNFFFEGSNLPGLKIISPFYAEDHRGYFLKSFEKEIFSQNGIEYDIFEDFESFSIRGVIRGLHFQTNRPQAKLVRAIAGEIYDVAVDLRQDSATFGQWEGFILSDKNKKTILIPQGFAHGFLVLSETALVSYKCAGKFSRETDSGIVWNDRDLDIQWPIEGNMKVIISEKDANLQTFLQYMKTFCK